MDTKPQPTIESAHPFVSQSGVSSEWAGKLHVQKESLLTPGKSMNS